VPDIQHAIQIAATPERIFELASTPAGLGEWWATDITETPAGPDLGFFNRSTIYKLRPVTMDSPAHAEWRCESGDEWSGTRLAFRIEPAKTGGCQLRFAHAEWRAATDYFTSCNTTWGTLMFRLKAAAEGKRPGPLFTPEGWVA